MFYFMRIGIFIAMSIITIVKKSKNQAFTIWESIISILILSCCVLSVNIFLIDIIYCLSNLNSIAKYFVANRNVATCYAAYNNKNLCTDLFLAYPYDKKKNR